MKITPLKLSQVRVARAYDDLQGMAGYRVLVDRVWPRGVRKEKLDLDEWAKDLAPSTGLRKWFNHEPPKWEEFCTRYFCELDCKDMLIRELLERSGRRVLVLIFAARDMQHNNAVALKNYLSEHITGMQANV